MSALVLEPFLTAIICLCASSYEPNCKSPIDLRSNFENTILSWNESVLETMAMASSKLRLNHEIMDFHGLEKRSIYDDEKDKKICDCEEDQKKIDSWIGNFEHCRKKYNETYKKFKDYAAEINTTILNNNVTIEVLEKNIFDNNAEIRNLTEQLHSKSLQAAAKDNEIMQLQFQHEGDQSQLEKLIAKTKYLEEQEKNLTTQIKRLESMAPPHIRSLKNNCLMAPESGVANLELRIKEDLYCAKDVDAKFGEGWILVAQRFDGSVDFNRSWADYARGFGAYGYQSEFFAGLERLYALTQNSSQELLLVFTNNKNETRYAHYDDFAISNENHGFALKRLENFAGDAGDALTKHLNQKFATFDKDNESGCATKYSSGWWFLPSTCLESNLFGLHPTKSSTKNILRPNGMVWSTFPSNDNDGLVAMRMYTRPVEIQYHIRIR